MERNQRAFFSDIDFGDVGGNRLTLDLDQLDQIAGRRRQRPETIDHFGGQALNLGRILGIVETAIQRHPHCEVGHVFLGDHDRRVERNLRAQRAALARQPHLAGFGREDRILKHRLVQFEADLADMPRLFIAKQIARAANVEIVAGELEASTQTVEIAKNLEALFCHFRQLSVGGCGQVCISAQL